MTDEMVEKVAEAVEKALKWYRMQYTSFLEDGSAYNLVDALTPPGQESVELGIKERELLAESITLDVVAALTPEWGDDMALVPRNPTKVMCWEGSKELPQFLPRELHNKHSQAEAVYKAMLLAAKATPPGGE